MVYFWIEILVYFWDEINTLIDYSYMCENERADSLFPLYLIKAPGKII